MSRRRQIHHAQSVAAKLKSDEASIAACAPTEALEWAEGSYRIVRLDRAMFRDKPDAIAEILRKFPGAIIGKNAIVRTMWVFRIREAKKGP
jgi:hypothetical protein